MKDTQPKAKPGWKTTEFWLTLVVLIASAVMSSGAVGEDSGLGKVLALVVAAGAAMGYTAVRGFTKAGEAKASKEGAGTAALDKLAAALKPGAPQE